MSSPTTARAREVGERGRLRLGRCVRRRNARAPVRRRHEIAETADDAIDRGHVLERLAAEIGARDRLHDLRVQRGRMRGPNCVGILKLWTAQPRPAAARSARIAHRHVVAAAAGRTGRYLLFCIRTEHRAVYNIDGNSPRCARHRARRT
jgi:hypothetical protein